MKLVVKKITGFCGINFNVWHNDLLFYSVQKNEYVNFNLPIGTYEIEAEDFFELPNPVIYIIPTLPETEKNIVMKRMNIKRVVNKNKASIDVRTGNTYLDSDIDDTWHTAKKVFILGHELGHNYYKTELYCDMFSAKKMLENGFNPSQCFHASFTCLSGGVTERKTELLTFLKQVKEK